MNLGCSLYDSGNECRCSCPVGGKGAREIDKHGQTTWPTNLAICGTSFEKYDNNLRRVHFSLHQLPRSFAGPSTV